jgi:maltooligosyltrehalose trehalohydrolase
VSDPLVPPLGAAWHEGDVTSFLVWAPRAQRVEVILGSPDEDPAERAARVQEMAPLGDGYHQAVVGQVAPATTYRYRLHREDGSVVDRPDPASRLQPQGVHGPSAVDDPRFPWSDHGFVPPPLHRQVLYELHVGTFSPQGTFDGAIDRLDELVDLGITTIELMPVAQFPGGRNWGYDGVLPFAVQDTYGGPPGLRRLVDAAHARGLAVVLDVVYNHVGPEGNSLDDFGPYFASHYETPWGPALNADGPGSDAVRRWAVENAVRWVGEFHLDGLRLDAVHAIVDQSATHLLEQMADAVHAEGRARGRPVHLIAESDLCDARLLRHADAGGYGLDAQWADDFHHALHVALTGERDGYYADYRGLVDLVDQLRDRYVYAGRWSPNRGRTVGRPAPDVPYDRFVVCIQNHDQVGNRVHGERLGELVDAGGRRMAATAMLTSPFVPLLFMGEEHADPAPFQYFTSHGDPQLAAAVTEGRREEFAAFESWKGQAPDPQDEATFERSRPASAPPGEGPRARLRELYRELLRLRREEPLICDPAAPDVATMRVPGHDALVLRRRDHRGARELLTVLNADHERVDVAVPDAAGGWTSLVDSEDERWDGQGASPPPTVVGDVLKLSVRPRSAVLLRREER